MFLSWEDRFTLQQAVPVMNDYRAMRANIPFIRVYNLRLPRPPPSGEGLCVERVEQVGAALMRFDFFYGDVIRFMGGEFTHEHRDFKEAFAIIERVRNMQPPPGYPVVDIDRAHRLFTHGSPLAGHFSCSFDNVCRRERYDNHAPLAQVQEDVRAKFAKEEERSYHVALPRWMCFFIYGLFLSPITWVIRKGKGRICIDNSSKVHAADDGAPNDYIPAPGTPGREDECPAVYYANALHRHLTQIWRLRIDHPTEDLIQHCDDIEAAFRRILYHPDMAIVFAYVFAEFLIIPAGQVFGSRNSPSYYCVPGEVRAHLASCGLAEQQTNGALSDLAESIILGPDLSARQRKRLVPAVADSQHSGVPEEYKERFHNATFVDDTGKVATRERIIAAIDSSVKAAFVTFGAPDSDRRGSCFALDKWETLATHVMLFLGFLVNTRTMTLAWPPDKRNQLRELIRQKWAKPGFRSPRDCAELLGLVRHAAVVAPLVLYLSLRLQYVLNEHLSRPGKHSTSKRWWSHGRIWVSAGPIADISLILAALDLRDDHPVWCRPIGLLVDRDPTSESLSDASYEGLGGWCKRFNFMWRLSRQDLVDLGFDMKAIDEFEGEPLIDETGLHINILEFIAIIVDVWLTLYFAMKEGDIPGGHILSIRADNTSALSWMRYASRSHKPIVRQLSRFLCALILSFPFPVKVSGKHIAGLLNTGADILSRPETKAKSWASVFEQCSHLKTLTAYRLPRELLSRIAIAVSQPEIEGPSELPTKKLWTLAPSSLGLGSNNSGSTTSGSRRRHRSKSSR
jgi:hypothetical protein